MNRILANGIELNVRQQGQGQPLLLVHGFPLDHTMWHEQIDGLSSVCRVIAPDLRGFGGSGTTAGTVTMEQLADDLAALLDALEVAEPVALCGLSMGGYVAWQFWHRHRRRLGSLILCDTKASADSPEAARARLESADRVLTEGAGFLADSMLEKLFAPTTDSEQPELVEATRQVILATAPEGLAAALRGMAERADATSWLPRIDVPTLVVCGRHDAIASVEEMRGLAAQIPGAHFREISLAGHLAPLENPAETNLAIREFLTA